MRPYLILTFLTALSATLPNAAQATVNITSINGNPGFLNGAINYAPTGLNANVGVGRFELVGTQTPANNPVDLLTYCVDIFHGIHAGAFEISPLSTLISNVTKQNQLLALLSNANPLIAAAATLAAKQDVSAAIQLSVWDIVNESGTNAYSLSSGNFTASGGNLGNALTLAGGYLSNVTSGTWTPAAGNQLNLLYAADNQSQVFVTGVPEPTTWVMMIGGFGLVGAAMRRRVTKVSYVTA